MNKGKKVKPLNTISTIILTIAILTLSLKFYLFKKSILIDSAFKERSLLRSFRKELLMYSNELLYLKNIKNKELLNINIMKTKILINNIQSEIQFKQDECKVIDDLLESIEEIADAESNNEVETKIQEIKINKKYYSILDEMLALRIKNCDEAVRKIT